MDRSWFRRQTWTKEDEREFFSKLQKVRNKDMQVQYLSIQAGTLAWEKNVDLMKVAESLLNKLLNEYSENNIYRSNALNVLGDIYIFREDYKTAIDYYKQAVDYEERFPNSISNAYLNYSEWVIKTKQTYLYEEVEKILSKERYSACLIFPISKYKVYSILSIISKYKGEPDKANYYAKLAEENAIVFSSELNSHKSLGVIKERDKTLDILVQKSLI